MHTLLSEFQLLRVIYPLKRKLYTINSVAHKIVTLPKMGYFIAVSRWNR